MIPNLFYFHSSTAGRRSLLATILWRHQPIRKRLHFLLRRRRFRQLLDASSDGCQHPSRSSFFQTSRSTISGSCYGCAVSTERKRSRNAQRTLPSASSTRGSGGSEPGCADFDGCGRQQHDQRDDGSFVGGNGFVDDRQPTSTTAAVTASWADTDVGTGSDFA